jgi:hypothetical protein
MVSLVGDKVIIIWIKKLTLLCILKDNNVNVRGMYQYRQGRIGARPFSCFHVTPMKFSNLHIIYVVINDNT